MCRMSSYLPFTLSLCFIFAASDELISAGNYRTAAIPDAFISTVSGSDPSRETEVNENTIIPSTGGSDSPMEPESSQNTIIPSIGGSGSPVEPESSQNTIIPSIGESGFPVEPESSQNTIIPSIGGSGSSVEPGRSENTEESKESTTTMELADYKNWTCQLKDDNCYYKIGAPSLDTSEAATYEIVVSFGTKEYNNNNYLFEKLTANYSEEKKVLAEMLSEFESRANDTEKELEKLLANLSALLYDVDIMNTSATTLANYFSELSKTNCYYRCALPPTVPPPTFPASSEPTTYNPCTAVNCLQTFENQTFEAHCERTGNQAFCTCQGNLDIYGSCGQSVCRAKEDALSPLLNPGVFWSPGFTWNKTVAYPSDSTCFWRIKGSNITMTIGKHGMLLDPNTVVVFESDSPYLKSYTISNRTKVEKFNATMLMVTNGATYLIVTLKTKSVPRDASYFFDWNIYFT